MSSLYAISDIIEESVRSGVGGADVDCTRLWHASGLAAQIMISAQYTRDGGTDVSCAIGFIQACGELMEIITELGECAQQSLLQHVLTEALPLENALVDLIAARRFG